MGKEDIKYKLPEGWIWSTSGEVGIITSGGTPSTKEPQFWGGDIPWITPADLSDFKSKLISKGQRNISKLGLAYSSAALLPKGSLIFSSRALSAIWLSHKMNWQQIKGLKILYL